MLKDSWKLILISYLILVIYWIDIDLISPALPSIASDFKIDNSQAHRVISIDLFIRCLCLVIIGPISDLTGRKKIIQSGTILMIIGSLICSLSTSIVMLYIGKAMQGAGCSIGMIIYSFITDRHSNKDSASIIALLQFLLLSSIVVAPILGSWSTYYLNWRYIFVFIAFIGMAANIFSRGINEPPKPSVPKITSAMVFRPYKEALLTFMAMKYIFIYALSIAGYVCWTVTGPFILKEIFAFNVKEVGYFQFVIAAVSAATSLFVGFRIKKIGLGPIFRLGLLLMYTSSILLFIYIMLDFSSNYGTLLFFLTIFSISVDMIICSSLTLFYKSFKSIRGAAAAINTIADNTISATVLTLFGLFEKYSLVTYSYTLIIISTLSFLLLNYKVVAGVANKQLKIIKNQISGIFIK